jgi:hypothetical protein
MIPGWAVSLSSSRTADRFIAEVRWAHRFGQFIRLW